MSEAYERMKRLRAELIVTEEAQNATATRAETSRATRTAARMRDLRDILIGEAIAPRPLYNLAVVAARDRHKPLLRPRPLTDLRTYTHAGDGWPLRFAGFLTASGPGWHHSELDSFVPVLTVGGEIWRAHQTALEESTLPRGRGWVGAPTTDVFGTTGLGALPIADLEPDHLTHWYLVIVDMLHRDAT